MTTFRPHEPDTAPIRNPEQPRQPLWREFGAFWAFGLREYRIWQSYRVNQVLWMTNLLVTTLLFFLLGQTISGQAASLLGPAYGTNYMSFVVIGVTVNVFINTNHMRDRNGLDTPLTPGDEVSILPAVSGG